MISFSHTRLDVQSMPEEERKEFVRSYDSVGAKVARVAGGMGVLLLIICLI